VADLPLAVVPALACPVCGRTLSRVERTLRCPERHSFDIARQGYVNLQAGHRPRGTADTPAMVAARAAFLDAGHYEPIAHAVATQVAESVTGEHAMVLEVGAGTGHYLAKVLDALPGAHGIATDVSTAALRRAARAHSRAAAVGADVWRGLPLRDGSIMAVIDVFAPRNAAEFGRVLHPDGTLVVVTPTSSHLNELVERLGLLSVDNRKEDRIDHALGGRFRLDAREELAFTVRLTREEAGQLVRMGPSAHHLDDTHLTGALSRLPTPVEVTAAVTVARYRPA
jgi:23S rRNA (guanine745-N1)-methyltransferase